MTDSTKKALTYSAIFLAVAALFIALANLVGYLTKPNNHNEARYGSYNIHMSGWDSPADRQFLAWANQTLPELNRLGPTFHIVDGSSNIDVIRGTSITNPSQCTTQNGVVYQIDTATGHRRIIIDPVCVNGELEFKSAFMHEIGHSLGMGHVCTSHDQARSDCSPVGRGLSVMNPNLLNEVVGEDEFNTPAGGPVPTWEIQRLDIQEFCRVRGCNK